MGWDDIEESTGSGADYVKIKANESVRLYLLDSEPVSFFQHRKKGEIKPQRCKGANCPYCVSSEYDKRQRFAINSYCFEAKKVQIFEQGKSVFGQIKKTWEAYEKDLSKSDIIVTKQGDGLNTKYTVVPVPTKFKPDLLAGASRYDLVKQYGVALTVPYVEEEPPLGEPQ